MKKTTSLVGLRFKTPCMKPVLYGGVAINAGVVVQQYADHTLMIRMYLDGVHACDARVQFPEGIDAWNWLFYQPTDPLLN